MALINRVSQLFKADFHAVLDQIEEPEQLLRQAIRDMQDDLGSTEQRINACVLEQEALSARKSDLENTLAEIDEQLDLCFESKKHDLARSLIHRKLEAGRLLKRLRVKHMANEKYLTDQGNMLEENRTTLEGLRQKAELFAQRAPCTSRLNPELDPAYEDIAWMAREMTIGEDEVEVAFLHEKNLRGDS